MPAAGSCWLRAGAAPFAARELAPWLDGAMNAASKAHFGALVGSIGQGGALKTSRSSGPAPHTGGS